MSSSSSSTSRSKRKTVQIIDIEEEDKANNHSNDKRNHKDNKVPKVKKEKFIEKEKENEGDEEENNHNDNDNDTQMTNNNDNNDNNSSSSSSPLPLPLPLPSSSSSSPSPSPTPSPFLSDESRLLSAFSTLRQQGHLVVRQESLHQISSLPVAQIGLLLGQFAQIGRIQYFTDGQNQLLFKLVAPEDVSKYQGLTEQEQIVYSLVAQSNSHGIWIRDLKRKSHLQQPIVTKVLKNLQMRKLIKCEISIEGKNKKVYMLYEMVPSKEIRGGSWYQHGEFDLEFVETLQKLIINLLPSCDPPTAYTMNEKIQNTKMFNVKCTNEEIEMVLQSLKYDGEVEEINSLNREEKELYNDQNGKYSTQYRLTTGVFKSPLTSIPCSVCPVADQCKEGNPIAPSTCEYFRMWMEF